MQLKTFIQFALFLLISVATYANGTFSDTTRAYAVPTLTKTPKGHVAMSWTEKDKAGTIFFYWAESADKGKTFGDKKLIHASSGIGASRLMRPKLLFRKDGSLVAVFSLRGSEAGGAPATAAAKPTAEPMNHEHGHGGQNGHEAPKQGPPAGGGRPRDQQIVYTISKDQGNTWTPPAPVHTDKAPNIVRGFFDATVLANGEIAVAYLNDIEGQAHQRDLRFVTSNGDSFGKERILDPFVCDCCNISLLVDEKGTLSMFYRENQNNIRDIAKMTSTDNGQTFSKPEILFKDNWQINGCPHSGPTSSASSNGNLIAWFSGSEEAPGIRVVTQQGKRLFVLDDQSARNAYLVATPKSSVLLWEQNQNFESGMASVIAYKNINGSGIPATHLIKSAKNSTNASGVAIGNQLIVAYEVRNANNKNGIEWTVVNL